MRIRDAKLIVGDCREALSRIPDQSVQTCVTSPPYWGLRDYGQGDQIGLEQTPEAYTAELVEVFREVRRVLRDDGTLWLNLGDSYAGSSQTGGIAPSWGCNRKDIKKTHAPNRKTPESLKPKDLVGIPWRVAFALQADGWYLRSDIIWHKPNPMPESVTDRPTKAHEYLFLLTKAARYYYDAGAIREKSANPERCGKIEKSFSTSSQTVTMRGDVGREVLRTDHRNKRSVWTIPTNSFPGAHFAVMPPGLVEPCILAGSKPGDLVLDPFAGAGTVLLVAAQHDRRSVGVELNPEYAQIARGRIEAWRDSDESRQAHLFEEVAP